MLSSFYFHSLLNVLLYIIVNYGELTNKKEFGDYSFH